MLTQNNRMLHRHKLMQLLDTLSKEQIIYLYAPAGYGKTVSARQWLERGGAAGALVTLDEFDNDIAHFCGRFCAALRECQPANETLQKITAHGAFGSAPGEFAIRAVMALAKNVTTRLVIDDLHFVQDEKTLRLLIRLLGHLPEHTRLLLAGRSELPPSFAELWLKGNLSCVTVDNLRFNQEEIISLYKQRGHSITRSKADEIRQFTDGWAIGIEALLLSDNGASGENLSYLDRFICDNIWQRWEADTREFMLQTAIIREMTPPICDAMTGRTDSEQLLNQMLQQNAFIARMENGAYRYHRLFRDYLLNMLALCGDTYRHTLLERAGRWYLENHDFHNARECLTECRDYNGLAQCYRLLVATSHEYFFIEKMLQAADSSIIAEVAQRFPYIYITFAWAAFNEGRAADMAYYADLYYANQAEIVRLDPRAALYIVLLRLVDFRFSFQDVLRSFAGSPTGPHTQSLWATGGSLGIINQNLPLLHRGTRDCTECAAGDLETNIAALKTALHGMFGEQIEVVACCVSAGLLYEQAQHEKALSRALAAYAAVKHYFASETKFFTASLLVYIYDALHQVAQAEQTLAHIAEMIESEDAYYLTFNFSALQTRRKLNAGHIQAAHEWLAEHKPEAHDNLDFYKLYGHITTCRAFVVTGAYDEAIALLNKVLALAKAYNRTLDRIEAKILLAIAYWKKKRNFQDEALHYLEQALTLAGGFQFTQIFVNECAELRGMLQRLHKRVAYQKEKAAIPASFIKMLYINMMGQQTGGLTGGLPEAAVKYTAKQLTVMQLLCAGKSYKEIAAAMGITVPTLRSHIALIYKKLDVTRQADAAAKIKALGILEEL